MREDRDSFVDILIEKISEVKTSKKQESERIYNKTIEIMLDYGFPSGKTMAMLNNTEEIRDAGVKELILLADALYLSGKAINPQDYFSEKEIKEAKFNSLSPSEDESYDLPMSFENVIEIDDENYVTKISIKRIKNLYENGILDYNFETQREAGLVKNKDKIIEVPKVYEKSVKEIKERLLNGTLSSTAITFNALAGTSDSGEELVYNHRNGTLTINEGTKLDILDGFHRLSGARSALLEDDSLEHYFILTIRNFNVSAAQKHLAEISKVNTIDKTHIKRLSDSRYSDTVVRQLQRDSDLKGKVSNTSKARTIKGELTSYSILSDTIEEEFEMKNKRDALEVAKYLTDFFDEFISTFHNRLEKKSLDDLMTASVMFAGYVVLAKEAREKNIKMSEIEKILKEVDFSRKNKEWVERNILNNNLQIKNNSRKNVKKFFRELVS